MYLGENFVKKCNTSLGIIRLYTGTFYTIYSINRRKNILEPDTLYSIIVSLGRITTSIPGKAVDCTFTVRLSVQV